MWCDTFCFFAKFWPEKITSHDGCFLPTKHILFGDVYWFRTSINWIGIPVARCKVAFQTDNVTVATPADPRGEQTFFFFVQMLGGEKLLENAGEKLLNGKRGA